MELDGAQIQRAAQAVAQADGLLFYAGAGMGAATTLAAMDALL